MKSVKIGFAPTRRSIFSAPDAVKYANLTRERLKELGVEFVDITDINEEGLFYDEADREKIQEKFRRENVKGIFFPHGNFGTEYVCARLAKEMGLPVLLWGPRDERPDENGVRLRDSQCGLFATGKVLRRFGVPFTYMTNCRLTDPEFERGIKDFLAVCNVVDTFRHTRILQIGPRPFDFWSTMCNEGIWRRHWREKKRFMRRRCTRTISWKKFCMNVNGIRHWRRSGGSCRIMWLRKRMQLSLRMFPVL